MSAIHVSAQVWSYIYTYSYCATAIFALLVYDWFLCLDQEVRFIWNRRSRRFTVSVVYAFSRYTSIINYLLAFLTIFPMSDQSCTVNVWVQIATDILGLIAFSTFSALRAYALSNRSIWLAAIIILLGVPSAVMYIVEKFYEAPENLPSPLNCSDSSSLSPTLSVTVNAVTRGSQFTAELLVVSITWWYTYQSYRIQKGIKLGKTVSSLLLYNGSMYFLFLATLYFLDILFAMLPISMGVRDAGVFLAAFIDPITSILTCRFMLSLRQFDSTIQSATYSGLDHQLREYMASTVLQFGAQPSDNLPAPIASFAHPVHVDVSLSETDIDVPWDGPEWQGMDTEAPTPEMPSSQSPDRNQTSSSEPWV